jgi:hypothetical protein
VVVTDLHSPAEDAARRRRLRSRNWALLLALLGFVGVVYVVTIVRMGAQ